MFTIELYQNKSALNVVDKNIMWLETANGQLKKGTSIIEPVITIHTDGSDVWRKQLNYTYISEFGRYYYVTDIVSVEGVFNSPTQINPTSLWELHMHVDVLMSYKDQIRQQTAIVSRQENTYNLMLDDGFFMAYQNPMFQTLYFSNPTPFESQEFVLVVAGA